MWMILHDSGLLAAGDSRKLTTPGARPLSRCRAALSASPLAPCSPPSGRSPSRAAPGAGCRPALAPGPPSPPRLPRWSQTGVLARVLAHLQREQIVRLTRAARSLARPVVQVPPAGPGARTQPVLHPSAAPGAGGPPRCLGVPRTIARRSPARARPGPPRRPGGPPVADSPGPAPRSSRGAEGPGGRGRPAAALGRGTGVCARGAAAAHPGEPLGVCP